MRDAWGVIRATHMATVRWLSTPHTSLKEDLLARCVKYYQSWLTSDLPEVSTIAMVVA